MEKPFIETILPMLTSVPGTTVVVKGTEEVLAIITNQEAKKIPSPHPGGYLLIRWS